MGSYNDHEPTTGSFVLGDNATFNSILFSTDAWSGITTGSESGTVSISDDMTTTVPSADDDPFRYDTGERSFEVPFLIAVCIFGVIGNLIVVAVYRQKQYRQSNAALYILNLAVGDLFILLIVAGFNLSEFYPRTWSILWRSDIQCILHRFGRFTGMNVTIFTMVAIAIDRYSAVVHAIEYKFRCPPSRTKKIIFFLWVVAAIAAVPSVVDFATRYEAGSIGENFAGKLPFACRLSYIGPFFVLFKNIYVSVILFYIPAAVTVVVYSIIVLYVWRNNLQFRRGTTTHVNHVVRSHWKTARVLLVVVFVFVLTYGFLATCTLISLVSPKLAPEWFKIVSILLPFANSCMNPVVYSLNNPRFRQSFRVLVASKMPKISRRKEARGTDGKVKDSSNNGKSDNRNGSLNEDNTRQEIEMGQQPNIEARSTEGTSDSNGRVDRVVTTQVLKNMYEISNDGQTMIKYLMKTYNQSPVGNDDQFRQSCHSQKSGSLRTVTGTGHS